VISLRGSTLEKVGKKKDLTLIITHPKHMPYAIRGDTEQETLEWYAALKGKYNPDSTEPNPMFSTQANIVHFSETIEQLASILAPLNLTPAPRR
jgi:hypothetical protein